MLTRHRAFVAFVIAALASGLGFQMLAVAVGWQIYEITGRAFDLGLVGLAQFIPALLLALPAGHAADRYERRGIFLKGLVSETLAIGTLAALTLVHRISEPIVLLLLVVLGVARTFQSPAMSAMLPRLVPEELLPRAMAANAAAGQVATIAGPALGGLLYVAGAGVVYSASAALYLLSTLLVFTLPSFPRTEPSEPASLKTIFAGVHFIRQRPDILGVISLDLFAVLLGGATALLPIFAKDILHTGPWGLGLLRAAPAIGALLMSLLLTRFTMKKHVGINMFAAVAGFGAGTIVFALSHTLWISLLALFSLGAFDMVSMVIRHALVQLETPDAMRGRVSAVNAIFIDTSNQLGEFESGMVAAWLGASAAALVGGIGTIVVVGVWMVLFPTIRKRQALTTR